MVSLSNHERTALRQAQDEREIEDEAKTKRLCEVSGCAESAVGAKFEEEVERLRPVGIRETEADRPTEIIHGALDISEIGHDQRTPKIGRTVVGL